jgi:hypothetical protein
VTLWITLTVLSLVVAVLVGWAVPAWAAGRLVRAIEAAGGAIVNFRGRPVSLGLGLVWLVWAVGVAAVWNLIGFTVFVVQVSGIVSDARSGERLASSGFSPIATVVAVMPFLLLAGTVAFGLADDTLGGTSDRGFAGHFRALADGRLTTGMLKLLGIGALAFVSAASITRSIMETDPMIAAAEGWARLGFMVLAWVAATLVIALAANFVNLTDLRPGRALKAYVPLALGGAGLSAWGFWRVMEARIASNVVSGAGMLGLPAGDQVWVWFAGIVACLLVLVFGPVLAVWRHDLGERAMLGDAGANAMGAFAGFLLARSAPLWLLGAFGLVLLALNLASERVSFSSVIERVPVLRWLDGLGRLPSDPVGESIEAGSGADDGTRAGGPAATDDDARRDDVS